jgi:hypothetical protein
MRGVHEQRMCEFMGYVASLAYRRMGVVVDDNPATAPKDSDGGKDLRLAVGEVLDVAG